MSTVRWGILSTAKIGLNQVIPAIQASGNGTVTAIASRDRVKAQEAAAQVGIPSAYGSYDDLLRDPAVDAVYIPLPNGLHAEWTIQAAQAGKHVLCEKSLCVTAEEARRMVDACEAAGVLLMEAFMWRHHPRHARVKELLLQGAIGEPRVVRANFSFPLRDPGNIRMVRELGGGALMDLGCYCINAARFLFDDEPVAVNAAGRFGDRTGVDMTLAAVLEFSGDRFAHFECSFDVFGGQRYGVVGDGGYIEVPDAFGPGNELPTVLHLNTGSGRKEESIPGANQYVRMVESFAQAILDGGALQAPAESGSNNMRVVDACLRSAKERRRVVLEGK